MLLKPVGYFFELAVQERLNMLEKIQQPVASNQEKKIVGYLSDGTLFGVGMGVDTDILKADQPVIGTLDIITDGVWVWPATLKYWVVTYHIKLPTEFMKHMANNNWKCPKNIGLKDFKIIGTNEMA